MEVTWWRQIARKSHQTSSFIEFSKTLVHLFAEYLHALINSRWLAMAMTGYEHKFLRALILANIYFRELALIREN